MTNDEETDRVEPHRFLLRQPEPGAQLFKVVKASNLINMLQNNYLHFQRVDSYTDDRSDGEQLPRDRPIGAAMSFEKAPAYTLEHYYDNARARTYACCFSLEDSTYLWENYAPGRDAVCLVFDFDKLRERLNATVQSPLDKPSLMMRGDDHFRQIFSINYGIVEYVERETHTLHRERMANPILSTFVKDRGRYANEKELRVSLSALGIGQFVMADGTRMEFPPALQMHFDYREAFSAKAITEILCPPRFVDASHLDTLRGAMASLCMMKAP